VTWSELLAVIHESTTSPNSAHREGAFEILSLVPELISDQDPSYVKQVFIQALQDSEINVRVAGFEAATTYIMEINETSVGTDLIPHLLNVLPPLMQENRDEELVDSISSLIELTDALPKVIRSILTELVSFMAQLMKNEELQNDTRQSALELLLTFAETLPASARKNPQFASTIIPIALQWMTELEDDSDWYTTDDVSI